MRHTSRFDLDCRRLVSILVLVFAFPCVSALSARDFVRGRINDDAGIDISDPVFLLVHLFSGGPAPECEDAADGNDDGTLDISDAVYLLAYLFTGGPVVPSPFPDPGPDPTPDDLTCGIPTGSSSKRLRHLFRSSVRARSGSFRSLAPGLSGRST